MGKFVKGEVVVVPFPFSDLSHTKKRPALVVADLRGDDLILVQITSRSVKDPYSLPLDVQDFDLGSLNQPSNIRPNRVFTADSGIVMYAVGRLKPAKIQEVVNKIIDILRA